MKTIKATIHHGDCLKTLTATAPTIESALADLAKQSTYCPESNSRGFDTVARDLGNKSKAERGWVRYQMESATPEPAMPHAESIAYLLEVSPETARAMHAAPELLTALQCLVGEHADLGEVDFEDEQRDAIDAARAAIAKATRKA